MKEIKYLPDLDANEYMGFIFPKTEEVILKQLTFDKDHGFGRYQAKKFKAAVTLCKQRRTALDIGAHVGLWSKQMAMLFKQVNAFEINSDLYRYYKHNLNNEIKTHRVKLYETGLSDSHGKCELTVPLNCTGDASILKSSNYDTKTYKLIGNVTTLDSMIFEDVDFIKIDVEGYEYYVLRGAIKTILKWKPVIIVEQKLKNIENLPINTPQRAALDLLESHGAKCIDVIAGDYIYSW
jgi:FkbM family methyltransferase